MGTLISIHNEETNQMVFDGVVQVMFNFRYDVKCLETMHYLKSITDLQVATGKCIQSSMFKLTKLLHGAQKAKMA